MSRPRFGKLMRRPEREINVAEAALLFARELDPSVDVERYLGKIDAIARKARKRGVRSDRPAFSVTRLNGLLFDEMGYRGDRRDYHNPLNSFLNHVIDRKLGIPISLSTLYAEVSRRAGLPLVGVGFPGHFLAMEAETGLIIDCFAGGRLVSREKLTELLRRLYGPRAKLEENYLRPAGPRETVLRMLNNLKFSYASAGSYEQALRIVELIDGSWSDLPENVRDRGLMKMALSRFAEALRDLERYSQLAPKAADSSEVLGRIRRIRQTLAGFN